MEPYSIRDLAARPVGASVTVPIAEHLAQLDSHLLLGPITGSVVLTNLGELISGSFEVNAPTELECARCLEIFKTRLRAHFAKEYRLQEGSDNPEEDAYFSHRGTIDIFEPIRQELLLAIPERSLHEPNCKGLCIVCGTNLNRASCPHHP